MEGYICSQAGAKPAFFFCHQFKTNNMSELTFESLLLEIRDSIERCATPTQLTSALVSALKNAEQYEDEWINALYESNEGYESLIH